MNSNLIFCLYCIIAVAWLLSCSFGEAAPYKKPLSEYLHDWEQYKIRFNKMYISESEDSFRFRTWVSRLPENNAQLRIIQEMNPRAVFGPTKFTDLTDKEWRQRRGRKQSQRLINDMKNRQQHQDLDRERLHKFKLRSPQEKSINYTAMGVTTFVRNQNNCGCCWAISTAENIEAQWFLRGHGDRNVVLSEQQLVSCDTIDSGCDGSNAYQDTATWIVEKNNGTLDTWASYPFVSGDGVTRRCEQNEKRVIGARGIEAGFVIASDEDEMNRVLVEVGPIQISVDSDILQDYISGIIDNAPCRSSEVDHEVLITAVSSEADGSQTWSVKNSWGTDWGYEGYFLVKKGTNQMCLAEWPYMWRIAKN